MPFVKLDTGIMDSSLWWDRDARDIFITALLMAVPFEVKEPMPQLEVRALKETGFVVPPGWYGFVAAAGSGLTRRSCVEEEKGLSALERLGAPEEESRSREYEGRRLVRVNGGYLVLNFMKYRDKDHSAADRQRKLRERRKKAQEQSVTVTDDPLRHAVTLRDDTVTSRIAESREQMQRADADASSTLPPPTLPSIPASGDGSPKKEKKSREKKPIVITDERAWSFADWYRSKLPPDAKLSDNWREVWAKAYEDMIRLDGRTVEKISTLCKWLVESWWFPKFQSPSKLRERDPNKVNWFDRLWQEMEADKKKHGRSSVSAQQKAQKSEGQYGLNHAVRCIDPANMTEEEVDAELAKLTGTR